MKTHSFRESLEVGHRGEEILAAAYPDHLERLDGRAADLRIRRSGKTIELKTLVGYRLGEGIDYSVTPHLTDSYCVERWSSFEDRTPGGPWAAESKGADYYAYLFPHDRVWLIYPTTAFVGYTVRYMTEVRTKVVESRNRTHDGQATYRTIGVLVPIAWYEPILVTRVVVPARPVSPIPFASHIDVRPFFLQGSAREG